jgi:integrase
MNGKVGYATSMKHKALRVRKGRTPSTVNGKVPPPRVSNAARRPREYLTPEEVKLLISMAQKRIGARTPHRDATLILIAYRHGLRASELCALRWDMLDLSQGRYHVTRRKNGRPSVHHGRTASSRASTPGSATSCSMARSSTLLHGSAVRTH